MNDEFNPSLIERRAVVAILVVLLLFSLLFISAYKFSVSSNSLSASETRYFPDQEAVALFIDACRPHGGYVPTVAYKSIEVTAKYYPSLKQQYLEKGGKCADGTEVYPLGSTEEQTSTNGAKMVEKIKTACQEHDGVPREVYGVLNISTTSNRIVTNDYNVRCNSGYVVFVQANG